MGERICCLTIAIVGQLYVGMLIGLSRRLRLLG
jgi:hypothetical protein